MTNEVTSRLTLIMDSTRWERWEKFNKIIFRKLCVDK